MNDILEINISRDGSHLSPEAHRLLQFPVSSGEAEDSAGVEEEREEQRLAQPGGSDGQSEPGPGQEEETGGGGLS